MPTSAYPATIGSSALRTSAPPGSTSSARIRLTASVRLERPVPIEVVGRDVGVDRDRRPARQRRQLQLRQLVDDTVLGGQLGQPLDDRHADVAAEHDRMGRVGGQDRRGQRRRSSSCPWSRSRRSVGATHSRRNRSGSESSAGAVGSPAARVRDECLERGSEARLGRREVRVDRRRRRHQRARRPRWRPGSMSGPSASRMSRALECSRSPRRARRRCGRRRRSRAHPRRPGTGPSRCRFGRGRARSRARRRADPSRIASRVRASGSIAGGRVIAGALRSAVPAGSRGTASRPGAQRGRRRSRTGS